MHPKSIHVEFSPALLARIRHLAAALPVESAEENLVRAAEVSGMIRKQLPELVEALEKMNDDKSDVITISGLMTGESPEDCPAAELLSLALSLIYGEPFQYETQNGGKLVARLEPRAGHVANTGEGSGNFGLHTDDAGLADEFRTKFIQLFGVNNDAEAATNIVRLDELMPAVPAEIVAVLMEPRFRTRLPRSFQLKHEVWSEPMPLLENRNGIWHAALPSYAAKPVNDGDHEAEEALARFIRIAEEFIRPVVIRPGTLVIFNNSRILHGRAEFSGRRLVLRTLVRPDLIDLRIATGMYGPVFPVWPLLDEMRPIGRSKKIPTSAARSFVTA